MIVWYNRLMKKCNKCGYEKSNLEYPIQRKGKRYQSMSGYCRVCRKKQMYENLNKDVDKFLSDKYNRLVIRAKNFSIPLSITKKEFIELYKKQKGKCFYTGIKMVWGVGMGLDKNSISIDKIIPSKGYTINNTVFCSNRINSIKRDMTLEELKIYTPKWYKKIIKKIN